MDDFSGILKRLHLYTTDAVYLLRRTRDTGDVSIAWANPRFCEMTRRAPDEVRGAHPSILVGPDTDRTELRRLIHATEHHAAAACTILHYRADGTTFWGSVVMNPVPAREGEDLMALAILRDVSDLKEVELQLRMREAEARKAFDHVKAARARADAAERRLIDAIDALPDGFAIFDAEDRLALCNEQFRAALPGAPDVFRPGTPFASIVRAGLESGVYAVAGADAEAAFETRMARHRTPSEPFEIAFSGDRHFRLAERRTRGGDLVTIRTEITDLKRAERALAQKAVELGRINRAMRKQAECDPLTGLANRRALDLHLDRIAQGTGRVAILQIDLDRFKAINDTLGHSAGDAVIVASADRLSTLTGAGGLVARVGGDEFVVVLSGAAAEGDVEDLGRRMVEALCAPVTVDKTPCRVGASVGVSLAEAPLADHDRVLVEADMALYHAKEAGRGCVRTFNEGLRAAAIAERRLADDIAQGLERGEFFPVYQPQFRVGEFAASGLEVLCRWRHPLRGVLGPDAFLGRARELSMVSAIDRAILAQARTDVAALTRAGLMPGKISFNVELDRLLDPRLRDELLTVADAGPTVAVELLETISLDDADAPLNWAVDQLREAGVQIEIDDFGSSRASILGLMQIRPHRVKFDRHLVFPIAESSEARTLLGNLVALAHDLGIQVIAEGVETFDHMAVLRELRVDVLQGYALARPMAFDALAAFLAESGTEGAGGRQLAG